MLRNYHYQMRNFRLWYQGMKHIRSLVTLWGHIPEDILLSLGDSLITT